MICEREPLVTVGSGVGQYSTSNASVRAISSARWWASGASVITRSKLVSASSSRVRGWWREMSRPISSITATANGSGLPPCTTPAERV